MLFADLNAGTPLFGTVDPVDDSVEDVSVCFVNIMDMRDLSSELFLSIS